MSCGLRCPAQRLHAAPGAWLVSDDFAGYQVAPAILVRTRGGVWGGIGELWPLITYKAVPHTQHCSNTRPTVVYFHLWHSGKHVARPLPTPLGSTRHCTPCSLGQLVAGLRSPMQRARSRFAYTISRRKPTLTDIHTAKCWLVIGGWSLLNQLENPLLSTDTGDRPFPAVAAPVPEPIVVPLASR